MLLIENLKGKTGIAFDVGKAHFRCSQISENVNMLPNLHNYVQGILASM